MQMRHFSMVARPHPRPREPDCSRQNNDKHDSDNNFLRTTLWNQNWAINDQADGAFTRMLNYAQHWPTTLSQLMLKFMLLSEEELGDLGVPGFPHNFLFSVWSCWRSRFSLLFTITCHFHWYCSGRLNVARWGSWSAKFCPQNFANNTT